MHKRHQRWILVLSTLICLFFNSNSVEAGNNVWTTTGPYGVRIYSLVIDPQNSNVVYAATPDGTVNLYKSIDGGVTWLPAHDGIPGGVWAISLAINPNDSDIIYVATEQGVYKSTNAGGTWELKSTIDVSGITKLIQAWSIAISPLGDTLYLGAYGLEPTGAGGGIFRSRDGGETWEHIANSATTSSIIRAIAVAPSAPHTIYAGGYGGGGIFKSMDWGDSWQRIDSSFGVPPTIYTIAVDPYDAEVVYITFGASLKWANFMNFSHSRQKMSLILAISSHFVIAPLGQRNKFDRSGTSRAYLPRIWNPSGRKASLKLAPLVI